jgi:hypothetical protein
MLVSLIEIYMTYWITLILALPSENATARTRLWRALKALGAASLRDGVWLLPDRPELASALAAQVRGASEAGGQAWLLHVAGTVEYEAQFSALFDRSSEYAGIDATLAEINDPVDDAVLRRNLRQARKHLDALIAIDFFPGPARAETERRLQGMEAELRQRQLSSEPGFAEGEPERLEISQFQNRLWATRRNLWVDRLASAWLIRRFIDPQACFVWFTLPQDCPAEALGFDYDGARFTHIGRRVSFETLLASFGLESDPALKRLAALVHTLDVGGAAPEAAGFEALLKGLKSRIGDDDQLLAEGGQLLNDLYAAFGASTEL